MKKNILVIIIIIIGMILALSFKDYNFNRSVSACVMAKQQTSETFDFEKAKKFCEETIKKQKSGN